MIDRFVSKIISLYFLIIFLFTFYIYMYYIYIICIKKMKPILRLSRIFTFFTLFFNTFHPVFITNAEIIILFKFESNFYIIVVFVF